MSEQPPAKRRRLDSSLHKPFKSPLRRPLEPKSPNLSSTSQHSSTEKGITTTLSQPNKSSFTVKSSTTSQPTSLTSTRPIKSSPLQQSTTTTSRISHPSRTNTTYERAQIRAL